MIAGAANSISGRDARMGYQPMTFISFQIFAASVIILLLCQIAERLEKR